MQRATACFRSRDDDAKLTAGGEIGAAEHGRRDERLARFAMAGFELAHDGDAVRAHHEMDRTFRQRIADSACAECDLADRCVFDEHRDDNVAACRELRDRAGEMSARRRQRRRLRRKLIEYPKLVPRVEQAPSHSLPHPAEAYETDLHLFVPNSDAKRALDFDLPPARLQGAGDRRVRATTYTG